MDAGYPIPWEAEYCPPTDWVKAYMDSEGLEYSFKNLLTVTSQQSIIHPSRLAAQVLSIKRNGPPLYFGR